MKREFKGALLFASSLGLVFSAVNFLKKQERKKALIFQEKMNETDFSLKDFTFRNVDELSEVLSRRGYKIKQFFYGFNEIPQKDILRILRSARSVLFIWGA